MTPDPTFLPVHLQTVHVQTRGRRFSSVKGTPPGEQMHVRRTQAGVLLLVGLMLASASNKALADSSTTYRGISPLADYDEKVVYTGSPAHGDYLALRAAEWFTFEASARPEVTHTVITSSNVHGSTETAMTNYELVEFYTVGSGSFRYYDQVEVVTEVGNTTVDAIRDASVELELPKSMAHAVGIRRRSVQRKSFRTQVREDTGVSITSSLPVGDAVVFPTVMSPFTEAALLTTDQSQRMPPGVAQLHLVHRHQKPAENSIWARRITTNIRAILPIHRAHVRGN